MDGEQAGRLLLKAAWGQIDWAVESVARAVADGMGAPVTNPITGTSGRLALHPRERDFRELLKSRGMNLDEEMLKGLQDIMHHAAAMACWGVFAVIDGVADVGEGAILQLQTDEAERIPTYLSELFYEYDSDERNHDGR